MGCIIILMIFNNVSFFFYFFPKPDIIFKIVVRVEAGDGFAPHVFGPSKINFLNDILDHYLAIFFVSLVTRNQVLRNIFW